MGVLIRSLAASLVRGAELGAFVALRGMVHLGHVCLDPASEGADLGHERVALGGTAAVTGAGDTDQSHLAVLRLGDERTTHVTLALEMGIANRLIGARTDAHLHEADPVVVRAWGVARFRGHSRHVQGADFAIRVTEAGEYEGSAVLEWNSGSLGVEGDGCGFGSRHNRAKVSLQRLYCSLLGLKP